MAETITDELTDSNESRLELLQKIAEIYVRSGINWYDVYAAMPKLEDYKLPAESLLAFLKFLKLFEYWVVLEHMTLENDKEVICELAKRLVSQKDFHKLPLGNLEYILENHCNSGASNE